MSDEYDKLRELLAALEYPSVYLYKFIVKQDPLKVVDIKRCFSETAEFTTRESKNGNYVTVSIREMTLTSDAIIERYKTVGKIENVITL
ncbi:MAG: putative lipoic acid-binding regulatory protein [Crocinitomix sp.]|jgi:putative lipoic acid-binding regulatory protein